MKYSINRATLPWDIRGNQGIYFLHWQSPNRKEEEEEKPILQLHNFRIYLSTFNHEDFCSFTLYSYCDNHHHHLE
jgi:hypothetical protein